MSTIKMDNYKNDRKYNYVNFDTQYVKTTYTMIIDTIINTITNILNINLYRMFQMSI